MYNGEVVESLPKVGGIYAIRVEGYEKFYVGSTVNLYTRCNQHFNDLRKNKHCNKRLQRIFNKYDETLFIFEILEEIEDKNNLIDKENEYFLLFGFDILVNNCKKAGSTLGAEFHNSEEVRNKISKSVKKLWEDETYRNNMLEKFNTTERNKKISEANSKRIIPPHIRERISNFHKGNTYRRGKTMSEEAKIKLSESQSTKKKKVQQFTLDGELIQTFESIRSAAKSLDKCKTGIVDCCNGKLRKSYGFVWKFLD